jgi:hypothetical protein
MTLKFSICSIQQDIIQHSLEPEFPQFLGKKFCLLK